MNSKKSTIAIFDFDNTITSFDSLNYLLICTFGNFAFYSYLAKMFPLIFLYKLNVMTNQQIKQHLLRHFFKDWKIGRFNEICQKFAKYHLPKIIKPEALSKINWHLENKHRVMIISASLGNWIKPWASSFVITPIITSKIEVKKGKLTGNLQYNCYGQEKINTFLKHFPNRSSYLLYAYGNSRDDLALIKIADFKFYQKF